MLGEHDVAGAIPVIPTACKRHRSEERDTILRRSSAEVRVLPMAPLHTPPSGMTLASKAGEQRSIRWRRAVLVSRFSGCSSVEERGVRVLEAAGAIPVTQTHADVAQW